MDKFLAIFLDQIARNLTIDVELRGSFAKARSVGCKYDSGIQLMNRLEGANINRVSNISVWAGLF